MSTSGKAPLGTKNKVVSIAGGGDDAPAAPAERSNFVKVQQVARYCQFQRDMGMIVGPPGSGKSYAATDYLDSNPHVYLATLSPLFAAPGPGLTRVAEACGLTGAVSAGYVNHMRLIAFFDHSAAEGPPLLIIDEAQHAGDALLDELRSLHDESKIGLLLIGNATFARRVRGQGAAEFAQLSSRLGARLQLGAPRAADVAPICERYGVTGKAERDLLLDLAQGVGGLRVASKLAAMADRLSGDDRTPALADLREATTMLFGEKT